MSGAARKPGRDDTIAVDGVSMTYRGGKGDMLALDKVDLVIERARFVTLFGPSGCGKSTLLRIVAGLETQSTGSVSLFGQTPLKAQQHKNISWIPQCPALLPWLTVRHNLLISRVINRRADRKPNPARQP